MQLFTDSAERYREGKFDEAAALLERAYSLHQEPVLLYNLGRAYEGMGDYEKAVEAYEKYVQEAPEAKDRPSIERRLETLKAELQKRKELEEKERRLAEERAKQKQTPSPTPERREESWFPGPLPYVVAGAGIASLGAGAFFGLQANSRRSDADAAPSQRKAAETFRDAESAASAANVFFVVGGVLTAAGVTWVVLDTTSKNREKAATLWLTAGVSSARVGGHF